MTGAVELKLGGTGPAVPRLRALGLAAASWLAAAGTVTLGPVLAFWTAWQLVGSGRPSMTGICIVVGVLAAVDYGLVALVRRLAILRERHGAPPAATTAATTASPPAAAARSASVRAQAREPLVLVDGGGAGRPWSTVAPRLAFGFDVLVAVLTRDGSLHGTLRAMDRAGWSTAHVVARPSDARAAVELARLGRARSLHVVDPDADPAVVEDPAAVATAIAEFAAFRPPS